MKTIDCPTREVPHAGNLTSPVSGDMQHRLRLQFVGTPGGLTNVIQIFSTLGILLDHLEFTRPSKEHGAARLEAHYRTDRRLADLLQRKLSRLLETLSMDVTEQGGDT